MTEMDADIYEAFRAAGAPDEKARAAAIAITVKLEKATDKTGTRVDTFKSEMKHDFERLEGRVRAVENRLSRIEVIGMIILAAVVISLLKQFFG